MERKTPLQHIAEQQARIQEMRAYIPGLVVQARFEGESWAAIGRALGTSKSEAYRRFKHVDPLTNPPAPPSAEP